MRVDHRAVVPTSSSTRATTRPAASATTVRRYSTAQLAKAIGNVARAPQLLDAVEQRIVASIDAHNDEAMARLKTAVEVNSGTYNAKGVAAIADMYEPRLKKLGFTTRRIDVSSVGRGQHLVAELFGGNPKAPRFLLIGHLDTVFEPSSPFQTWETLPNGMIHGPGAGDMKSGNEIMLSALEALQATGALAGMNITVWFSGDEESPGTDKDGGVSTTRGDFIAAAKTSDIALSFEGGGATANAVKTAKRGTTTWVLQTQAVSGHSSQIFKPKAGPGAIYPLSQMVARFQKELRAEPGVTVNVGATNGGARVETSAEGDTSTTFSKDNIIPRFARASGDLRFLSPLHLQQTRAKMQAIIDDEIAQARQGLEPETAKALQANIAFTNRYPGMPETPANVKLFRTYSQVSEDLGFGKCSILDPKDSGAADISFAAPYATALLDGLGATGAFAHSTNEIMDPKSVPIATKRAAVLLYRMTKASAAQA